MHGRGWTRCYRWACWGSWTQHIKRCQARAWCVAHTFTAQPLPAHTNKDKYKGTKWWHGVQSAPAPAAVATFRIQQHLASRWDTNREIRNAECKMRDVRWEVRRDTFRCVHILQFCSSLAIYSQRGGDATQRDRTRAGMGGECGTGEAGHSFCSEKRCTYIELRSGHSGPAFRMLSPPEIADECLRLASVEFVGLFSARPGFKLLSTKETRSGRIKRGL